MDAPEDVLRFRCHKRRAVSELVATMLLLAMTVVAGFALFGFVRAEAGSSELSYAQNVGGTIQYLQEAFVVPQVSYSSSSVTIYVYTSGEVPTQLAQVEVFGPSRAAMDVIFDASHVTVNAPASCAGQTAAGSSNEQPLLGAAQADFSSGVNSVATVVLTLPSCSGLAFSPGTTYFVELLGVAGDTVTYYQAM